MLQNDIHELYIWVDTNNMEFNTSKFELLRYVKKTGSKDWNTYKSLIDNNIDSNKNESVI